MLLASERMWCAFHLFLATLGHLENLENKRPKVFSTLCGSWGHSHSLLLVSSAQESAECISGSFQVSF